MKHVSYLKAAVAGMRSAGPIAGAMVLASAALFAHARDTSVKGVSLTTQTPQPAAVSADTKSSPVAGVGTPADPGPPSGAPSALAGSNSPAIWHTLKGPMADAFADLVDDYNRQHPRQMLQLRQFASSELLLTELRRRQGQPDAPLWVQWSAGSPDALSAQLKSGAIENVQNFLEDAGSVRIQQASMAATAAFRNPKGKWVALPLTAAVPVVMYRADAFEKVGLPRVAQFDDWKDLQNAAWRLREKGSACGIASPYPAWVHVENMSGWHNQPVTTRNDGEEGKSGQYAFNALPQVRHMALIMSWVKSDLVFNGTSEQALQAWADGRCPILMGPSTALGEVPDGQRFNVVVTPLPLWQEVSATQGKLFPNGDGLYLLRPANREQKAVAAAFANHWFEADVAAKWHQRTGAVPLTPDAERVTRKAGFYERIPGWGLISGKLAQVKSAIVKPFQFARRQDVLNAGDKEIQTAFESGKAAKSVLDDSVRSANALSGTSGADRADKPSKGKP